MQEAVKLPLTIAGKWPPRQDRDPGMHAGRSLCVLAGAMMTEVVVGAAVIVV